MSLIIIILQHACYSNYSKSHNYCILKNQIDLIQNFKLLFWLNCVLTGFAYNSKLIALNAVVDRNDLSPSPGSALGSSGFLSFILRPEFLIFKLLFSMLSHLSHIDQLMTIMTLNVNAIQFTHIHFEKSWQILK